MADKLRADNNGDILVEFDYNNIIVVDPNRTIKNGVVQERLVDHENLVMYANLEAEMYPRTKLAVGGSISDRIKTTSLAKINFLKPGNRESLNTGYYDQLTGKNARTGNGVNQMADKADKSPDGTTITYGEPIDLNNIYDNGLLGITQISVQTNSSLVPTVRMELEDVRGKALFELGNYSPYAAFFNLPYPQFFLTLKGYYGQAIRYQLNLLRFNARFNTVSGNYQVSLDFVGYKFNILSDISIGHLLALPHMYNQTYSVSESTTTLQQTNKTSETEGKSQNGQVKNNPSDNNLLVNDVTSSRGYQKMLEVYSEYKSKELIPNDFPELTLIQLVNNLQNFIRNIENSFPKVEVEPLTNIRTYKEVLKIYFSAIRGNTNSWFNTYLNPSPLILKGNQEKKFIYVFDKTDINIHNEAITQLKSFIDGYNKTLDENPTLGKNSKDKIPNPIKYDTFLYSLSDNDIDWAETTKRQTGIQNPGNELIDETKKKYVTNGILDDKFNVVKTNYFIFDGDNRFDKIISSLDSQASKKLQDYEASISAKLLKKIEDKSTGIGFKPTVRNMLAVIFASAEAFIRLMDDVHTNAWNVKDDPIRKRAILENTSSAPSPDKNDDSINEPVYPWPLFFVESQNDKSKFELRYIGDPSVSELTQAFVTKSWPEVEFLEEYLVGLTKKFNTPKYADALENDRYTNTININAIEYPSFGLEYLNKEEIKFFYEIWERQFITSHYSGLIRANRNQINDLINLNTETEVDNIVNSVVNNAPYLSFKLKNYNLNASNYIFNLEEFSNGGTGKSYQDFIRGFFVTKYLKDFVDNPTSILSAFDLGQIPQTSTTSQALKQLLNFATNDKLVVDTIPFTDPTWCLNNMSDGGSTQNNEVYNTKKTLTVFEPRKIISNFTDVYDFNTNRPVTNFHYLNVGDNPYTKAYSNQNNQKGVISGFYSREPKNLVATEGYARVFSTTSMFNTPYFINAIQIGADNIRKKTKYPFIQSAYLFLNSLPLASLREKYKTFDTNTSTTTDLDYIASCFNKFGAIHKLPNAWILKLGSIWYRYKLFKEKGVDILTDVWKNFEYKSNFDPILSSETKTYKFSVPNYNGQNISNNNINITLQKEETENISISVGFYPKLINDFNVFYNGFELYVKYTDEEIQNSVSSLGMKVNNFAESNISTKQGVKDLSLTTWSVLLKDYNGTDITCDQNVTNGDTYYITPSFGSQVNQTINECIFGQNTVIDLTNNSSMYNGSIRTLWSTPNYGYFNNDVIKMPKPHQYINRISSKRSDQYSFMFLNEDNYSSIEEIFSVFEKSTLDKFEQEFLNFCKPITDSGDANSLNNVNVNSKNFQSLMKSAMSISLKQSNTPNEVQFQSVIEAQNTNFQNQIKSFLEYDVIFRNGNPSKYRRRSFGSYLNNNSITNPIVFKPYVPGTLPTNGGNVTLENSKLQNINAWSTLETEVGFSTIKNVEYSSNGSYITDFFVDSNVEFSVNNVVILSPLIKMYASRKLEQPNFTVDQFKNQIILYLNKETEFQNNLLDLVLTNVKTKLPAQQETIKRLIPSAISGNASKAELWDLFKSINDKWISGDDFKNKTFFEDVLLLDRASRNIGDVILVDIFDLEGMFSENSLNNAMSVYTFFASILYKNNFVIMNLPAYVNFYNIQNVDGKEIPNGEGSLDFGNSMWGTFLDVDYRKSSPKLACFYTSRPSAYVDLPKDVRYRSDAFDLRRYNGNPLIENQENKKDWSVSNRCVGFNVDIGIGNQNVFESFAVSQENGVSTSESINLNINMANQVKGKNVATQSNSLYNIYKNRSYTATVTCLGNALIQPAMYFNLRHVPMFNGPYMILDVQHQITSGNFKTSFTGIRQSYFDLPLIDNFLQSINQNLLTKLEEILHIDKTPPVALSTTETNSATQVVQSSETKVDAPNSCSNNVNTAVYSTYVPNTQPTTQKVSQDQFKNALIAQTNDPLLQAIIYSITYVRSYVSSDKKFVGYNNNFGGISLSKDWGATKSYFSKSYSCIGVKSSNGSSVSSPYAGFESIDKYIQFMVSRLTEPKTQILEIGIPAYYACYWPNNDYSVGVSEAYFNSHIEDFSTLKKTIQDALNYCVNSGIISKEQIKQLGNTKISGTSVSSGTSVTSGVNPNSFGVSTPSTTNTSCPPPKITSFYPVVGNEGTRLQINGTDLDKTNKVYIADKVIETSGITFLNSQTIRVTVPKISNDGKPVEGKIKVVSIYGEFLTTPLFKYDPSVSNIGVTGNTNPQIITLLSNEEWKIKDKITNKLTVNVNPDAGLWNIKASVVMNIVVFDVVTNNNVSTQNFNKEVNTLITTYVKDNVFQITYDDVLDIIVNKPREPFITTPLMSGQVVKIRFTLTAIADDKVKNPKPTTQSFNFLFSAENSILPGKKPTFPEVPLSITLVGESDVLQGSGPEYFNIKKPSGGYICYKFNATNFDSKNYANNIVIKPNGYPAVFVSTNGTDTKYTYVMDVKSIGEFNLVVEYRPYGLTSPPNGIVLVQKVNSPKFIL